MVQLINILSVILTFVAFKLLAIEKVSSAEPLCDITDPFSDPCGDAGLCVPSDARKGYSCECSRFKSTLYDAAEDETSCTGKVKSFCPPKDRKSCNNFGECRSGYGTFSCLCESGHHNQYCSGVSAPNVSYYQSPMILFKVKAALGSIHVLYLLAQATGTQPSFKIFDRMERTKQIRQREKRVAPWGRTREYRNTIQEHVSNLNTQMDQEALPWRSQDQERSFRDGTLSGRDFCVQELHDETFCSIIPDDVKPAAKIQYPATKRDTVDYVFDSAGNFRGQQGAVTILLLNQGRLQFKQNLFLFGAAQGNRSSCIPHLKLQDCSLEIPYLQHDAIVLRAYISPSIFCRLPVALYTVRFQWEVFAGFGKLFTSNFPFQQATPSFSSSEQNILIPAYSLYQNKASPYNVHTVFLKTTLIGDGEEYVNNAMCQIKVLTLKLVAKIKGGAYRTQDVRQGLILNGSLSSDPNEDPKRQGLSFSWTCHNQKGVKPDFCHGRSSDDPLLRIRSDLLTVGDVLTFKLTVQDSHKELNATDTQVIYLTNTSLNILCVKNCEGESRASDAIYLNCRPFQANRTLVWSVDSADVGSIRQPDTTPDVFIIKPGSLVQGRTYVVTVADFKDPRIRSSYELTVGKALKKGSCEIYPASGTMGKTKFTIKCKNFATNDPANKLVYEFYQSSGIEPILLGFNYIGTIRSVVLTYGDVRVSIYDRIGNTVQVALNVVLADLEVNNSNIQNITKTIETTRKLLDRPSMLRHIQVLTRMLTHMDANQQQISANKILHEMSFVFDDVENALNYLLIRQLLSTLKYFLASLKDLKADQYYLEHRIVRYTGQYLLQSAKTIHNQDTLNILESHAMITDVNLYQTNQMVYDCFALLEVNRDHLLESPRGDGLGHGKRYYSYLRCTRDVIDTLNYTGLITQSSMFPQQAAIQHNSSLSKSLFWNKIDSPQRLSNLGRIPNDSQTFVTLNKRFVAQFGPDVNLSLQVVVLKENFFWWYQPDEFGVNTSICGLYLNQVNNREFKPIEILDRPISIHLEVRKDLRRSKVTWNATKYGDEVTDNVKNSGIGSHRIPDLPTYSAIFVQFRQLKSSDFHLVWTKEQRPSTKHFVRDPPPNVLEDSKFLLLPTINADNARSKDGSDVADHFMGILPAKVGNHEYTFEMHRIDCRRWINDRWIIDPFCRVNNLSTLRTVICDCRHMSKFSASVLVVPNLVDPLGDAGLLLTVLDNPTPVVFVGAILLLYLILLVWSRSRDKMDTHRGRIVVLKDNCPEDEVVYLVTVYTGSRPGSGTTSDVCIQLFGEHGASRPHLLQGKHKLRTLQRTHDDWFLILTPHHLGRIDRIKLWSNHAGRRPDWYCYQVEVRDFRTRTKYLFFVQRWLSVLQDDECLEVTVRGQEQADPRSIWKKMWEWNVKASMQEKHPAASFLIRHPRTTGSRVEKLSVAVAGLMTLLVASLMFYEKSETDEETFEFYEIHFRDLAIAWESMAVEFLTMGLVLLCFDKSRPDPASLKEKIAVVDEDEKPDEKPDEIRGEKVDENRREGGEKVHEKCQGSEKVHEKRQGGEKVHEKRQGSEKVHEKRQGSEKVHEERQGSEKVHEKRRGSEKVHEKRQGSEKVHEKRQGSEKVHEKRQSMKSGGGNVDSVCKDEKNGVVDETNVTSDGSVQIIYKAAKKSRESKIRSRESSLKEKVIREMIYGSEGIEVENSQGESSKKIRVWRSRNCDRCLADESTQEIFVVDSDDEPTDEREEKQDRYCTINAIEDMNKDSSTSDGLSKSMSFKITELYCTESSENTDLQLSRSDMNKEMNNRVDRMEKTGGGHRMYHSVPLYSRQFYSTSEVTDMKSGYFSVENVCEAPHQNNSDSTERPTDESIRETDDGHYNRDSVTTNDKSNITVKDYSSDSIDSEKEKTLAKCTSMGSNVRSDSEHSARPESNNSSDTIVTTKNTHSTETLAEDNNEAHKEYGNFPRSKNQEVITAEVHKQNDPFHRETKKSRKQSRRNNPESRKNLENDTESCEYNESYNRSRRNGSKNEKLELKKPYNGAKRKCKRVNHGTKIIDDCIDDSDRGECNRLRRRTCIDRAKKRMEDEEKNEESSNEEKDQNENERKENKWDPLVIIAKMKAFISNKVLEQAVIEPYFPTSLEKREQFLPKVKKAWFVLAWTLLITNIVLSAYLIVLYGLKFGKTKSIVWLSTSAFGIGQDFFFATPAQILLYSFVLAKFYNRTQKTYLYYVNSNFYKDKFKTWQKKDGEYIALVNLKRLTRMYRPMSPKETLMERRCRQKADVEKRLVREVIICVLSILIVLNFIDFKFTSKAYFNHRYYHHLLLSGNSPNDVSFRDIRNQTSLYDYLNTTLLPVLSAMSPDAREEPKSRDRRESHDFTHQRIHYRRDLKNTVDKKLSNENRIVTNNVQTSQSNEEKYRNAFDFTKNKAEATNNLSIVLKNDSIASKNQNPMSKFYTQETGTAKETCNDAPQSMEKLKKTKNDKSIQNQNITQQDEENSPKNEKSPIKNIIPLLNETSPIKNETHSTKVNEPPTDENRLIENRNQPVKMENHPTKNRTHPIENKTLPITNRIQNVAQPTSARPSHLINQHINQHFDSLDNTKLISSVRVRQQRVKPNTCRVSGLFTEQFITNCNDNLSPMSGDMRDYEENWETKANGEKHIEAPNDLSLPFVDDPLRYQNETVTNTARRYSQGTSTYYSGGGYVMDLGSSANAMTQGLSRMIISKWIDDRTRVVFLECSLYNPNINAIVATSLVVERLASNTYSTDAQIGLLKLITNVDMEGWEFYIKLVLYLLLILLYSYQLLHLSRYGLSQNNAIYDTLILFLTILTMSQYFTYGRCLSKTLKYYQSSKEISEKSSGGAEFKQHVSFSHCARVNDLHTICLALLTFLIFCRVFKLVQFFTRESLKPFRLLMRLGKVLKGCLVVAFFAIVVFTLEYDFLELSVGTLLWVVQIVVVIVLIKNLIFNG